MYLVNKKISNVDVRTLQYLHGIQNKNSDVSSFPKFDSMCPDHGTTCSQGTETQTRLQKKWSSLDLQKVIP